MYNKRHICTYQFYDEKLDTYIVEPFDYKQHVEGLGFCAEEIYRADLCNAFNTKSFDTDVGDKIKELISIPQLMPCFDEIKRLFPAFAHVPEYILFSYHFFYLTHYCICTDYSNDSIQNLMLSLKNHNDSP
jgi:hypothetical protein